MRELEDQKELLPSVLALESLTIKAANGEKYDDVLQSVRYSNDFDFIALA